MTVCGQEVSAPVLALVADPQRGAVLGFAGVVGADQLQTQKLTFSQTAGPLCDVYYLIKNSLLDADRIIRVNIGLSRKRSTASQTFSPLMFTADFTICI